MNLATPACGLVSLSNLTMNDVRLPCSLQIAICGVEIGEFCCILIDARLEKAKLRDIKVAVVLLDK